MKSATPKHFHPILGRRDGRLDHRDRPRGRRRADRRRRLAGDARRVRRERRRGRRAGDAARHRRRGALRARRARAARRRRARALRRHAAPDRGAAARARRDAPSRAARTRRSSAPSRPTRVSTVASSATPTAPCARWSRGPTQATDEQRIREINSSIYVFRSDALWPALEQLEPKNVQGELYLTDAIEIIASRRRQGRRAHRARRARDGRREHARRARARGRRAPRPDQRGAHARRGDDRRPEDDVDRADGRARARLDRPARSRTCAGDTKVATGAEIGANTVAIDAHIGRNATIGPFCYLRPGTVLGESSKAGTFVEIKNSRIGDRSKVPHLSYIGDAEIGEDTNVGAGAITANFPHRPGQPKGRTTDREQRQDRYPQWLRGAGRDRGRGMDRSRIGDNEERPFGCAGDRPSATGEQGGVCSPSARPLSSSSPASRPPRS